MALTESEKTELKNDILNAIKAESQGVNELTEVTSLDNIKSLPALRGTELVSAPLTLLGKPATDAAATANAAATKANNAGHQCRGSHERRWQRRGRGEREGRRGTGRCRCCQ